jgi:hypothetical protein
MGEMHRCDSKSSPGYPRKSVLYITAREGLYRIPPLTQGPARLGK